MHYIPLRVIHKSSLFTLHITLAFLFSLFAPVFLGSQWHQKRKGKQICQWWSVRASNILRLQIIQHGDPINNTTLFVANHISFLDIIVLAAVTPVKFLSKKSLRYWPVIGFISSSIGTIFIKRGDRHAVPQTIQIIAEALQDENSLVIFPEGTTTLGTHVEKFNSGLFQAAVNTNKPIQPVALRYVRNGEPDRIAAYINNDNFIVTLIKIMAQTRIDVELYYCAALETDSATRSELAVNCHAIISDIVCQN